MMKDQNAIVKKINELYVLKRSKFLLMLKNGEYITIQYDGKNKRNQIMDWRINAHLNQKETLGVFSGSEFTKFICFDVDIPDKELAKWSVYKLVNALTIAGIPEKYIQISISGNKGFHVEIFFNNPIHNKDVYKFYLMILNESDLLNIDYGQVELRPLSGNGVKIPLGKHMKTGNTCWYCDFNKGLKPIKNYEHVLTIDQLDSQYFYGLLNLDEFEITEKQAIDFENNIKEKYKPLSIYKENVDEDATVESISKLIQAGLTMTGTRHNSLLKIAKYCKYNGLNNVEAKSTLIKWMELQDDKFYTTKWEDIIKDINGICDSKYYDKYTLTIRNPNIDVTKQEIEEILNIKGKNEQLILYCMLIHKKRYATKDDVFYVTYDQLSDLSGLSRRTAIRLIKKLEELCLLDVTRDMDTPIYNSISNTPKSKPNKYKINLLSDKSYIEESNSLNICNKNCTGCFNACLCKMYSDRELKKILPRRQYEDVIGFRDYCEA